jgi:hypothetical protein
MSNIATLIHETYSNPKGYYPRLCLISLRDQGFSEIAEPGITLASGTDRYMAWVAESIYAGLKAVEEGNIRMALRCALQAKLYLGGAGGVWFHNLGDAFVSLQSAIEDGLKGNG